MTPSRPPQTLPLPVLRPAPARLAGRGPAPQRGHAAPSPGRHAPDRGQAVLTRMATEAIATVAAEAYEVVEEDHGTVRLRER